MDQEKIKKALDHFENDEYVDAKEILTKEIKGGVEAHLKDKLGLKGDISFNESLEEARGKKPAFGTSDGFSYAVNIPTLDSNEFLKMPFGRQLDDSRKVGEWKKTAKKAYVGAKGKGTLPSVKKWVKENKPSEFYAKWKMDSSSWKDDSVEIFYKK